MKLLLHEQLYYLQFYSKTKSKIQEDKKLEVLKNSRMIYWKADVKSRILAPKPLKHIKAKKLVGHIVAKICVFRPIFW